MKHTEYYKSGKHKENAIKAQLKGTKALIECKEKRIIEYEKMPSLCRVCNLSLTYEKRDNKFCSRSCSATFNNKGRILSEESKQKIGKSVLQTYSSKTTEEKYNLSKISISYLTKKFKNSDITYSCPICNTVIIIPFSQRNRKTCGSMDCRVQASVGNRSYQNGNKKAVLFYNPYQLKTILLDSSWEVRTAELLISKNIKWIRPSFIKWKDKLGKIKRYFPDFYLPDLNVYLDPKNPYCLSKDNEKIEVLKQQITLIVGSMEIIEDYINNI
jgi:hypothetical protein